MEQIANAYQNHRPLYHFSAERGWINDPNGLVFDGRWYHLFYQYYPDGITHGPMHWGHARTEDFLSYEDLPIALYPDGNGEIFSGSAVIDQDNTSGFGSGGTAPMIAVFTHHRETEGRTVQSQSLAVSVDGGRTFTPYKGNPVIVTGMQDFRDPKVFWHAESARWIMVVVAGRSVRVYRSANLRDWRHCSTFTTSNPEPGGIWECPDLLRLQTPEGEKWVLLISVNSGPGGAFGMQYFVGGFDGTTFTAETPPEEILLLDFGLDHYAAVTYNGIGDRVVLSGWMNCWFYAEKTPAKGFRGAMTLPRELALTHTAGGYKLSQKPVRELWDAVTPCERFPAGPAVIEIDTGGCSCNITLSNGKERLIILHDAKEKSLRIDRTDCFPLEEKNPVFDMAAVHYMGESCDHMILILDTTSIELFTADGLLAGTMQCFPQKPFHEFHIEGNRYNINFYQINARVNKKY